MKHLPKQVNVVAQAVVAKSPQGEPSRDIESLRGGWASPRGRWRDCLSHC
jgi:hypothetical protein